jgi:hypothetical protein
MSKTVRRLTVTATACFLFVFGLMGAMPAHAWCGSQWPQGCRVAAPSVDLASQISAFLAAVSTLV